MDKKLGGSHSNPICLDSDDEVGIGVAPAQKSSAIQPTQIVNDDNSPAQKRPSESNGNGSAKRPLSSISSSSSQQAPASSQTQPTSHQGSSHFAPFRLFTTAQEDKSGARPEHCSTLREMLGIDGEDSGRLGPMRWIVIFNYLIDFDYLLDKVPELLSCRRALVFYGTAMGDSCPENWRRACTHHAAGPGGRENCTVEFVRLVPSDPPRSKFNPLPFKMPYGVHHSKMFLVGYDSCLRLIIHTANLLSSSVHVSCNGAYMQDFPLKSVFLPAPPSAATKPASSQSVMTSTHCASDDAYALSSLFEENLVSYLESYHRGKKYIWPLVSEPSHASSNTGAEIPLALVEIVRRYDYSSAFAVLIPSVPGWHKASTCQLGHLKLRSAIRNHTSSSNGDAGPIICQFSSMGSLTAKWIHEFASSLDVQAARSPLRSLSGSASRLAEKLKLVWPTVEEVRVAVGGYQIGGHIPGRIKNLTKDFLVPLYHRWSSSADPLQKRLSAPHIKTFMQLSSNEESIEWAVLTSHNLSRAAWGELQRGRHGETLFMRHWELGVFFSPELFPIENITTSNDEGLKPSSVPPKRTKCSESSESVRDDKVHVRMVPFTEDFEYSSRDVVLPLPFDTKPARYTRDDVPWTVDRENTVPDAYGRFSC